MPIEKYAIARAGNERLRCSVRSQLATTSSTSDGGNVRVSTPTETRSESRRSDAGFLQPGRGTQSNYTIVTLTERYWDKLGFLDAVGQSVVPRLSGGGVR